MIGLKISFNPEAAAERLKQYPNKIVMDETCPGLEVVVVDKGMGSGKPSIVLILHPQGSPPIVMETSAKLLCSASDAIKAKYPELLS